VQVKILKKLQGKTFDTWVEEVDALQEIQRLIMKLDKPLIAAVTGYALGGDCEFAMSCDIRIATDDAKLDFRETSVGLTVTTAGSKLLSHLVGVGKAKELVFTGEFVDATEAFRIGLVNRVVPSNDLLYESKTMASKISEKSELLLKLSRIAIDHGLHSSFEHALELEASHLLACIGAQDLQQFVDKKLVQMNNKRKGASS